jgi:hypothetical protein
MCTSDDLGSDDIGSDDTAALTAADALRQVGVALDCLGGTGGAMLQAAELGEVLEELSRLSGRFAAVRAEILARFDACRGYRADGYGSSAAWLAARGRETRRAAGAEVRRMRQHKRHPVIAAAQARGDISDSWAAELSEWTRKLPPDWRADVDAILIDAAANGANLEDLAVIARAAYEQWRSQQPDPAEDDSFEDRYLKLGTTIDNAGRVTGDLTPECTAALQAVLESLGKKAGPEDDRTEPQRFHDALQLACQLLIRARMVPDRAGADTRVDAVISLAELMVIDGASVIQDTWLAGLLGPSGDPVGFAGNPARLAALAGQPGYLTGKDAEAVACDAIISPVVTGHPDLTVVDTMIGLVLAYLDGTSDGRAVPGTFGHDPGAGSTASPDAPRSGRPGASESASGATTPGAPLLPSQAWRALSPEAGQALRYAIARLALDLVSGPGGLASALRRGLLDQPYASKSVILDIGYSATIPGAIRRAVQLRARHCEWPGCRKPLAWCDVHHLRHKRDGGPTSVTECVALCQYHHDVCIHRQGWRLTLHPDGTTTAHGPRGQVIRSHGPPGQWPPGQVPSGVAG